MKLSTSIILASLATASAFTAGPSASRGPGNVLLRMSEPVETTATDSAVATESPVPVSPPQKMMSQALPFAERPPALDGSMVGDVGFDPLGFAKDQENLVNMREAEIKHGRLAMLVRHKRKTVLQHTRSLIYPAMCGSLF
jgi:dihydropteroate synthase